ncbi:MAG: XRE family transcriptional regulator [Planctomycetota bacterium]
MAELGYVIRARRQAMGLTLASLAREVGCAKGYLSQIETGRRDGVPSDDLLERLERALQLNAGELVSMGTWRSTPRRVRDRVVELERGNALAQRVVKRIESEGLDAAYASGDLQRLVEQLSDGSRGERTLTGVLRLPTQVPVVNRVAAGYPREFTDLGYPARVSDEYVSVPDVFDPDAFAARVVGDAMVPVYVEGDVVVFSPQVDTVPGSDCFVRFELDDETTFKRVYFEEGASGQVLIRLQPLNSAYAPQLVEREALAGMYAAVYVLRPVGGGR